LTGDDGAPRASSQNVSYVPIGPTNPHVSRTNHKSTRPNLPVATDPEMGERQRMNPLIEDPAVTFLAVVTPVI